MPTGTMDSAEGTDAFAGLRESAAAFAEAFVADEGDEPDAPPAGTALEEDVRGDSPSPAATPETPDPPQRDATLTAEADPSSAEGAPPVDDPLKDAKPFGYVTDGDAKTFEGIHVLADGALVDADAIPRLQQILSRHDHYERVARDLSGRVSAYERLGEGKPVAEAFATLKQDHAKAIAAVRELAGALGSAEQLAELALNPDKIEILKYKIAQAMQAEGDKARQTFTAAQSQTQQAESQALAFESTFRDTITAYQAHYKLTDDDTREIAEQLTPFRDSFFRKATAADVQANPALKVDQIVIDAPKMNGFFASRAKLRADLAKQTTTTTQTAKENAARLAAATPPARNGKRPGAGKPAPTKPEEMSFTQMKRRALAGRQMVDQADD